MCIVLGLIIRSTFVDLRLYTSIYVETTFCTIGALTKVVTKMHILQVGVSGWSI